MGNKYHAGTEYTNEQQDQLDYAYQVWLALDLIDDHYAYSDEAAHDRAEAAYNDYEALRAEFDASNAKRRVVAAGNQDGLFFVADELMEAEVSRWYNAALVGLRPLADALTARTVWAEESALGMEEAPYIAGHPSNGYG